MTFVTKPEFILLDPMMPVMNGFQFLDKLENCRQNSPKASKLSC